uniref:Laminin subunit gamma-1 n=1 Tax=Heliothis virescens TaxID=7102 RepID=A0A2A4JWY1_HELVI
MAAVPLQLITFICIIVTASAQDYYHTPRIGSKQLASCYNSEGVAQRCIPEFENAAFMVQMEATNTCGDNGVKVFCIQTSAGTSTRSCDSCQPGQFSSYYLTDLHYEQDNQTWWQSETMKEGIQYPNQVNLTLHLGKAYDITYVRIVFYSPRPQSFAVYKKTSEERVWEPFQYFSASCRDTYGVQEQRAAELGAETRALCTSEYSDISPLSGGNVLFSTLEGRPSAYTFDNSPELQEWVTATDLRISLDRLNTFGDEIFGDVQVLQSYWYAIADVAVGARCKCNGHASVCETQELPDGTRARACRCEHFTAGRECERCLDFYNDAPWGRASPTNVHECKACNCNGFSNKCEFDKDLYERTGHGGRCIDCAENRDGANCERCKENFFQGSGEICLPCNCNPTGSRSLQCNAEGKCQCKPGVTGDKCDVCAPNHYEFTSQGCKPCGCNESGSYGNTPQCDPQTGVCLCKQNVEGRRCRECKPGFFNLDIVNEFGCTPCFCFGHSSQCSSAPKYQAHETSAHFIRDSEKWAAEDEQERTAKLQFNANTQNIAVASQGVETLYFVASSQFLGDQRPSYNHDLKFSLRLGEVRGYPSAQDIILEGPRASVSINIYAQNNPEPTNQAQEYTFRLHEDPRYGWSPTLSNFEFMSLLQNLTAIKIRGTYNKPGEGYLMNFKLETAKVGREKGSAAANWVEKCSCPKAYVGDYCEECAPGYKHEPANGGPYSTCIPCDCNGHAHICDTATGFCICKHNTTGSNCELCAKGFYGNAIAGTPDDCKPCPCPKDSGCIQLMDGSIVCTDCPEGYAGPKCEVCADGYFGDPTGQFGPPKQCELCQCNGNVDPNAVGNCNRTTGECLKCIYNTAGEHCDKCLSGFFGDALDPKQKGDCKPCQCHEAGTVESAEGPPQCDGYTGFCTCHPHVIGRNCDKCEDGYFNINSGEGCEPCECNLEGSYNNTCDPFNGQCYCKPGFCICKHNTTGSNCELCAKGFYGNAIAGTPDDCKPCPCPKDSGCIQLMDGSIVCTDCPEGYAGPKCEVCADGYFGDPTGQFGPPKQCELCQCNGNVDPNAVGNCNRTTGECLKCIYNTAGEHCDKCLSGFFGDALDPKQKGDCKPCQCHEAGTVESAEGPPQCDGYTGFCTCHPHVIGRNCDKCEDGYFNINSGEGCEPCECNLEGSYNNTCDPFNGQCYCKPGIDGKHCDRCRAYHYGFSPEGCRDCDCDEWGSTNYQCDMSGQCSCQENVEGRRCDRCMENKKRRADGQGCEDCPPCYNLVLDAVNQHRRELKELDDILAKISKSPTVVENADFDNELQTVRSEIERLSQEAQAELGNGPGDSLTDNLAELADRLADVRNMLFKIEDESYDGNEAVEKSKGNVSKAEDTIEAAQKEINSALEYMDGEGAAALSKARNRSDQFGKQSVDMSALAKESRLLAEKLENEAKNIRDIADKAFNTSITANIIAKDGITKQANISNEVQILTNELNAASGKLNSMTELADQALKRAKEVYEEALGLYAEVNTTLLPDIKLNKLKDTAREMNKTIDEKSAELERLVADNEDTLQQLEDAIKQGRSLLDQGHDRQDELNDLLAKLDELQGQARNDVDLTNQTLKDANEIYKTLKEFSDQVTESRQLAEMAALDVPSVQQKIAAAEDSINSITEQLYTASDKAKEARDLAQQAQKEYADKASEAAFEVRKKSSTSRAEASKLRFEAEKLSTRVQGTATKIADLEKEAAENMQLTRDAKMKVGQANTDAREAEKQVSKGLEDLKIIMDELQNLPTLDDEALDRLQESLNKAESDLIAVDLDGKIKSLTEAKNNHQRWKKQYEDEHDHLRLEVDNIKEILDQLPEGCFKRIVLEPTEVLGS